MKIGRKTAFYDIEIDEIFAKEVSTGMIGSLNIGVKNIR